MKTKKEIYNLNNAIGKAISAYYKAIEDNLKECGKEILILSDDEDDEGLRLSVRGCDNDLINEVINKVRWNNEMECVEYHLIEYNGIKCDDWYPIDWLDDCKDYVYESIDWEGIID